MDIVAEANLRRGASAPTSWHVFTPWGFAGLLLFHSPPPPPESNRAPFDLPGGRIWRSSPAISSNTRDSKFAIFFMAEYFGMFAAGGMAATLFLGGYAAPVSWLDLGSKLGVVLHKNAWASLFLLIWVRGTCTRLRMDQLMNFAWKFMLPMALIEHRRDRGVAFRSAGCVALDRLRHDHHRAVSAAGARVGWETETDKTCLSLSRNERELHQRIEWWTRSTASQISLPRE